MRGGGSFWGYFFITLFILVVDLYSYRGVRSFTRDMSLDVRRIWEWAFFSITIFTLGIIYSTNFTNVFRWPHNFRTYVFAGILLVYLAKIFLFLFVFTDDIIRVFRWIFQLIFRPKPTLEIDASPVVDNGPVMFPWRMSRLKFISQLGMGVASFFIATGIYGIIVNAYNYRIHRIRINLPNLPESFSGLKIVQISDIHSGSFTRTTPLEHAVESINAENADLIFFTGDLVNDRASEIEPYLHIFGKLKAKEAIFSTYGNHDYGDYDPEFRRDREAKKANMTQMATHHKTMGWDLLMDEHRFLKRGDDKIAIIGIQNSSGKGFHTYGDLEKAYRGTESAPVKLLLSHDPSYWDSCINKEYQDIDITFSGHTHGAQFGIEIPGMRWSPSQYIYKQWAGLYEKGKQLIYVNRGFGFLGYPGRVGILPEITVFELYSGPSGKTVGATDAGNFKG